MRLNYTDDEDFPGQFALWQGNCRRSLRSKAGQAALKRLEAALLALPEKRLIREALVDSQGGVCAFGALAKNEGIPIGVRQVGDEYDDWEDDDNVEDFGISVGFPRLVAWKVVEQNDIINEDEYGMADGPNREPQPWQTYHAGVWSRREIAQEERYRNVLKWVQENIKR